MTCILDCEKDNYIIINRVSILYTHRHMGKKMSGLAEEYWRVWPEDISYVTGAAALPSKNSAAIRKVRQCMCVF